MKNRNKFINFSRIIFSKRSSSKLFQIGGSYKEQCIKIVIEKNDFKLFEDKCEGQWFGEITKSKICIKKDIMKTKRKICNGGFSKFNIIHKTEDVKSKPNFQVMNNNFSIQSILYILYQIIW